MTTMTILITIYLSVAFAVTGVFSTALALWRPSPAWYDLHPERYGVADLFLTALILIALGAFWPVVLTYAIVCYVLSE